MQLGIGNAHDAGVCANSTLGDLHNVGVWNDSAGSKTKSVIQPSVLCRDVFSTGIWDVSNMSCKSGWISETSGKKMYKIYDSGSSNYM